jgi:hypothetical protein
LIALGFIEAAWVVSLAVAFTRWFAGPTWLPVAVPLSALALSSLCWWWQATNRRPPVPSRETLVCVSLALLYRLPALLWPGGWVNRDGAYGAFVALHLLQGHRPAPVFTEGANYQGTLKGHVAATLGLLTGSRDLPLLMVVTSLLLFLLFLISTMALSRRLAGRSAALATGLYLALGPRFLTVFSVNCVGQYMDVLALGGLALALLARILDGRVSADVERGAHLAVGVLLGMAFWQQPVALSYAAAALVALMFSGQAWRPARGGLVILGLALGALPVVLWNLGHGWASSEIMGRDTGELAAQAEALPFLLVRTLTVSFPVLAGLSRRHPWAALPFLRLALGLLVPALLGLFLALRGREILASLRRKRPGPALLPPLLAVLCLLLFWSVASGRVYVRPRYLLPVMAATAVHLGVLFCWLWQRSRIAAGSLLAALLAVNVSGTIPRLRESPAIEAHYRDLVRSLEDKAVRTGYADFSLSAPVTMFTAERIVLSSRLGPTPAYESDVHSRRVEADGPDAFVLRNGDDVQGLAARLRDIGVAYRLDLEPVPVFHGLSRRVRVEEVAGFRGESVTRPDTEE